MALQTCQRCRKRRIKCDLDLPACGNCALAEVECVFYDDSLQQEIPRSYLNALQEKVEELRRDIKVLTSKNKASSSSLHDEAPGLRFLQSDFHLGAASSVLELRSATTYVGPGNSAQLTERLLNGAAAWCISNNPQNPEETLSRLLHQPAASSELVGSSLFPLKVGYESVNLLDAVPPSTQQAIILHYFKVIHPQYPLISSEQEARLLEFNDPFRWTMGGTHPDQLFTTSVFAVSTALIARDLDANFSSIANTCADLLRHAAENAFARGHRSLANTKQAITALCFLALLELVNPVSGELWNLVGRALADIEQLCARYRAISMPFDDDFRRLELSLLKLESSLALHFRRPSPFCETWPILNPNGYSSTQNASKRLVLYNHRAKITEGFSISPLPSQEYFEGLIPRELRVLPGASHIDHTSAVLYLALHPLFTTFPSEIFSELPLGGHALDLFNIIARCAALLIDEFSQMNRERRIICVWMSAERVLEAGLVWATFLIKVQRMRLSPEDKRRIGKNAAMAPLLKCSTMLASFAERWKDGSIYLETWETLLSLVWAILD